MRTYCHSGDISFDRWFLEEVWQDEMMENQEMVRDLISLYFLISKISVIIIRNNIEGPNKTCKKYHTSTFILFYFYVGKGSRSCSIILYLCYLLINNIIFMLFIVVYSISIKIYRFLLSKNAFYFLIITFCE